MSLTRLFEALASIKQYVKLLSMTTIQLDKQFFMGGNATFTVQNPQGEYYTFKICQPNKSPRFRGQSVIPHFASLLTGPDNENSYTYLGMVNPETGDVKLTRQSRYTENSKPFQVIRWALKHALGDRQIPDGYQINHAGHCGRCGRLLTVPESLTRGIGPECWSKMGGAA